MPDELEKADETTIPEEGKVEESAEIQVEGEVQDPSAEEIAEQEETQRKMEAHKESSKFGRRLSSIEQTMNDFMEKQTQVMETMSKNSNPREAVDPNGYVTVGDLERMEQDRIDKANQVQRDKDRADTIYGRGYEAELQNIADEVDDEDIHAQVMKLVTDPKDFTYNTRSSNDPAAAAQINYNRALRSIKSGNKVTSKANLKHDKNLPPSGGKSKTGVKTEKEIVFSQDALDYMARTGTTVEEAKKLLKV